MSMTKEEFEVLAAQDECFVKSVLGWGDKDRVTLVYSPGDEVHLYKGKYHEQEFHKFMRWLEDAKADK